MSLVENAGTYPVICDPPVHPKVQLCAGIPPNCELDHQLYSHRCEAGRRFEMRALSRLVPFGTTFVGFCYCVVLTYLELQRTDSLNAIPPGYSQWDGNKFQLGLGRTLEQTPNVWLLLSEEYGSDDHRDKKEPRRENIG